VTDAVGEDLALALHLADLADELTLAAFGRAVGWRAKRDGSPVTEVDTRVEQTVVREIAARCPEDRTDGEELGRSSGRGREWVIDPIDHTRHFLRGNPEFATLITLVVDGRTQLGLASAPALRHRWWAVAGGGAWKDGNRISVSEVDRLCDAHVAVAGAPEWGVRRPAVDRMWDACGYPMGAPGGFLYPLFVAEGVLDAALEPWGRRWDHLGLALIVREAGGGAATADGSEPQGGSLVTANRHLIGEVLGELRS
jgi:histidinol-phosphatase